MKPNEAYTILKKQLDDGYDAVVCKDLGSCYGFFISQNGSNLVGNTMVTVAKHTRSIGYLNVDEMSEKFATSKTIEKFKEN